MEFAGVMGLAGLAVAGVGVASLGLVGILGAGLGLALVGIGVKVALMSAQVKSAVADAKKSITSELQQVAAPVNNVVADIVRNFTSTFQSLRPQLSGFFTQLAPVIQFFGQQAQKAFTLIVDGGQHALATVSPLLDQLSAHLVPTLHALGVAGHNALGVLATNSQPLGDLLTSIEKILPLLGSFIGALVNIGAKALPVLHAQNTQVIAGLTRLATLLGNFGISIIPAVARGFGDIARSLGSGLTSILPSLTQAFNGILPALGTLSQSLFPALAQIIRAILPVLTQMVQAIGAALGPVLPVVGKSVAGLAQNFGRLFSAITPLLGNIAQLAAWITVVTNNLVGALAPVLAHMISALTPGLNSLLVRIYQLANGVGGNLANAFHIAEPGLVALAHAVSNFLTAAGPLLTFVGQITGLLLGAFGHALNTWATGMATILNLLAPFAPLIVGIIVAVKEWSRVQTLLNLAQNSSPLQRWIVILGLAVGWFQQAHGWVKILAGAVLVLVAAIAAWTAVTWAYNAANSAAILQQIYANTLVAWATVVRWANNAATIAGTVASWAATAGTIAWAAATWVLNAAMAVLTSPITLVVLAIAALAAGVYLLIRNWKTVVDFLHGPWGTAISAAIAVIFPFIGIPLLIIGHWKAVVDFFKKLWSDVTSVFSAFANFLHGPWGTAISGVIAVIFPFIGIPLLIIGHWHAVADFFRKLWSDVSGFFSQHWRIILAVLLPFIGIPLAIARSWGSIAGFFSRVWKDVTGFVSRMATDVAGFFARMWRDVTGFASRIWHDVVGFVVRLWHDEVAGYTNLWREVTGIVSRLWKDVTGFFSRIWRDVSGFVARLWHDVVGFFTLIWHNDVTLITNLWRDVTGWISRLWRDVTGWISRLWRDVTGFFSRIWHDVTGLVSRLWQDVTGFASRIWHDVTGWVNRLWHDEVAGFTNIWHDVTRIWQTLFDTLSRITHDVTSAITGVFHSFWDGLTRGFDATKGAIGAIWDGVKHVVGAPVKVIIDVIYTHGIRALWDAIVSKIPGVPNLPAVSMPPGWIAGGPIPGNSTFDDRLIPVAGGEHVWTAEEVRQAGGHQEVARLRSMVMGGRTVQAAPPAGYDGGYILGGGVLKGIGHLGKDIGKGVVGVAKDVGHVGGEVFSGIGHVLAPLTNLVRGALDSLVEPAVHGLEGLADHLIGGDEQWSQILRNGVHGIGDAIINFVKADDAAQAALAGGTPIDWNGGPITWPLIEQLAKGIPFGNVMQVTSTTGGRHAPGSYHARGEAVDFSNGFGNTPEMLGFNRGWAAKYGASLAELIYTSPGSVFIKDGKVVGSGFYSGVLAEHQNHVHVAISLDSIARGHQIAAGVGGLPGASSLPARQYAASILSRFGWGQDQMASLIPLWQQESGWNPYAVNSSSGAYGIPQALGKGHPFNLGDYVAQINWGLNYIKSRYGSPAAAEAHERSAGWYLNGIDYVPADNWPAYLHRGERVLTAAENQNYSGSQQPVVVNVEVQVNGVGDPVLVAKLVQDGIGAELTKVLTALQAGAGARR